MAIFHSYVCLPEGTSEDYFPEAGDRFTIIALLQMMSTFGELVAPVFGGRKNPLRHEFPMAFPWFSWFSPGFCSMFFLTVGPCNIHLPASPWVGFTAQFFSWRFSFVILALLWGFMAIYAALRSVESCPDGEQQSCWALLLIQIITYIHMTSYDGMK